MIRRFNNPTGLEANQQIWLELSLSDSIEVLSVQFNEIDLPLTGFTSPNLASLRWPIVDYLRGNNQVVLELKVFNAIALRRFENRRLVEIQPLCSVQLLISESDELAS